ncbi:arginine--tRNA ligase [Striga asiatica]|uniref:Arginine--tRNA ligase n=1 Tax=Striga asiatica TaxID=4170 RepID=A0A5A7PPP1_STRAF|nr:arginine--tRNA ligase [Striga asiatica]
MGGFKIEGYAKTNFTFQPKFGRRVWVVDFDQDVISIEEKKFASSETQKSKVRPNRLIGRLPEENLLMRAYYRSSDIFETSGGEKRTTGMFLDREIEQYEKGSGGTVFWATKTKDFADSRLTRRHGLIGRVESGLGGSEKAGLSLNRAGLDSGRTEGFGFRFELGKERL